MRHRLSLPVLLLVVAATFASCAPHGGGIVPSGSQGAGTALAANNGSRRVLATLPGTGTITGTAGVECTNPILAFVCTGPAGSSATLAIDVQLGPFGIQPSRCFDVSWHERIINQFTPSSAARNAQGARVPRALGDPHYCGEAAYALIVTAPSKPGGYVYKGASASFTACFDDLPNPCVTANTVEGRLALISVPAASPSPLPSGSGAGGSGGGAGNGGSGGGGGPCTTTASSRMVYDGGRAPSSGVVGGGGGPSPVPSPSSVPTPVATETPSPVPTTTPTSAPSCSPATPSPTLELTMTGVLQTPDYPVEAPAYVYEDASLIALQNDGNGGVVTAAARRAVSATGGAKVPCVGRTIIDAVGRGSAQARFDITCVPPAIVATVDVTMRRYGFNRQNAIIGADSKQSQRCGSSKCRVSLTFSVNGTGLYELKTTYSGKTEADSATSTAYTRIIPFNEAGLAYPQYVDSRYLNGPVPFPNARTSFVRCPGNLRKDAFGCYARDFDFADRLRKMYGTMGWNMAIFKYTDIDAHHIHPLQWGGDNEVSDNGVFLVQNGHRSAYGPWWNDIIVPDPV